MIWQAFSKTNLQALSNLACRLHLYTCCVIKTSIPLLSFPLNRMKSPAFAGIIPPEESGRIHPIGWSVAFIYAN